jgi:hypothetical protein
VRFSVIFADARAQARLPLPLSRLAEGADVASHRDAVDLCWMLIAAGHVTLESCVLLDKKYPTSLTGHKFFKVAEGHPHGASKQEKNRITKRCN